MNRSIAATLLLLAMSAAAFAQTADEVIAKYVKTIGGIEKVKAIKTVRRTGKVTQGGGFEAPIVQENKRPGMVREEFILQGLTGVSAYDGKMGWKIEPWSGKRDAEALSEDEMKDVLEEADFDGPLLNYREKNFKVEYVGMDTVEGTDTYKLKVTSKDGDVRYFFMDADTGVPIKIETKHIVRGAEQESETWLGDYKEVAGVYFPFAVETGPKGSQDRSKITYDKIEANVALGDDRFTRPTAAAPAKPQPDMDASKQQPAKKPDEKPAKKPGKP